MFDTLWKKTNRKKLTGLILLGYRRVSKVKKPKPLVKQLQITANIQQQLWWIDPATFSVPSPTGKKERK